MKQAQRPRQPWFVTVQLALVLCFTIWQIARCISSLSNWDILITYQAQPIYIFATGLFWSFIGLSMFWLIWQAKRPASLFGRILSVGYLGYAWLDRLIIQINPSQNIAFQLSLEFIFLLLFFIPFSLEEGANYYIKELP